MTIEEKEIMYFTGKKIDNAKSVLELIKSEMSNKNGCLSNEIIIGALTTAINTLNDVSNDMI